MQVDRVTGEVVSAMDSAGIATILLKGPSIARWLYPEGGRTYVDTDLLVQASDHARAADVLTAIGFVDRFDGFHAVERRMQPAEETGFVRPARPGKRPGGEVDLHRNLPFLTTPDEMLWQVMDGQTTTLPVGGTQVRVLNRTAVALHVVLHAVQHGFGLHTDEDLRRAIAAMPTDDWGPVAALAARLGVDDVLGLGLRRHPAGAQIADDLGLPHLSIRESPYRWALLGGPPGAISLALLREAQTWREKASLIRWQLVPSAAKVRHVAHSPVVVGAGLRPVVAVPGRGDPAGRGLRPAPSSSAERDASGGPEVLERPRLGTVCTGQGRERRNDALPQ